MVPASAAYIHEPQLESIAEFAGLVGGNPHDNITERPFTHRLLWRTGCSSASLEIEICFQFPPVKEQALRKNKKQLQFGPNEIGSLDTLPSGQSARVVNVQGSSAIARRLMEMGVVPGAHITVVRTAPLGDPIQVCLRSYHLALRRMEARAITVLVGA
jgi:ferrous iron transport protein A